jgi:3',5'-cyclic AMP phosphodiesterase CpdA
MPFRIAHISDTHLSADKPFFVANFDHLATAFAAAPPDLLLNTGYISLNGSEEEADLAEARRLHDRLGLELRFIPGNHDLGDNPEIAKDGHPPITAARRARYCRHFGADWWQFDLPGWRLIGVNAQLLGAGLAASAEQEAFIAAATAGATGRSIALFIHKPLFDKDAEEDAVTGRFVNPEPRRRLFAALGGRLPALVGSGHTHQFRATETMGMAQIWAPSTGFIIPDTHQPRYGTKQVGYVEHLLHPDGRCESRFLRAPEMEDLRITDFADAYG